MSNTTEAPNASDEQIRVYPPRERSGYVDYAIGKLSVTWRGGDLYMCNTCQGPDRWQNSDHRGCKHIARIVRYREEHPS
jgi:hypothetical protein